MVLGLMFSVPGGAPDVFSVVLSKRLGNRMYREIDFQTNLQRFTSAPGLIANYSLPSFILSAMTTGFITSL
jgi:hypothetical protein